MSQKPRCYDCLSGNVTVRLIDPHGFEHWFCAEDWAAGQEFSEAVTRMLENALMHLDGMPGE